MCVSLQKKKTFSVKKYVVTMNLLDISVYASFIKEGEEEKTCGGMGGGGGEVGGMEIVVKGET